jgi:hypothetical protein
MTGTPTPDPRSLGADPTLDIADLLAAVVRDPARATALSPGEAMAVLVCCSTAQAVLLGPLMATNGQHPSSAEPEPDRFLTPDAGRRAAVRGDEAHRPSDGECLPALRDRQRSRPVDDRG